MIDLSTSSPELSVSMRSTVETTLKQVFGVLRPGLALLGPRSDNGGKGPESEKHDPFARNEG